MNQNDDGSFSFHPTWNVVDSTKLEDYMECPRRFFYCYVLGWRPEADSQDLVFGQAWHLAMQYLLLHGYEPRSIVEAYNEFLNCYRQVFPDTTDDIYKPKNPAGVIKALTAYVVEHRNDSFDVLYTEVAGSVPIGPNRNIHFKMDDILRDRQGQIFSLEHKTTKKSFDRIFYDKWAMAIQPACYQHALCCVFPPDEVWGVKINATCFQVKEIKFRRLPVRRNYDMLSVWLATMNTLFEQLEYNFDLLSEELIMRHDNKVMHSFEQRPISCTSYRGCPYINLCLSWANPLQHIESLPMGFKTEFWDPSAKEVEANAVIRGTEIIQK